MPLPYIFTDVNNPPILSAQVNANFTSVDTEINNAKLFGAQGAGLAAQYGGAMVSGSNVLTLVSNPNLTTGNATFLPSHVGYTILIPFAGTAGADLYATITAYTSATEVTVSATNASATNLSKIDVFWWPAGSDDTDALQNAIDAGGTVFLPPGVYPVSASLTNSASLARLVGSGRNTTFIVANNASMSSALFSALDAPWGFVLQDICFKGRGQSAVGTENCVEFKLSTATGANILTVNGIRTVGAPANGLYIQCLIGSAITNSIFDDIGNAGLMLDVNTINGYGGTSVTLAGCYSYDNIIAYYLNNYAYSSLNGCAADSNNENYYLLNCENVVLTGCGCEVALYKGSGDPGTGYIINGGTNNSIIGCYWTKVPNALSVGIVLQNSPGNTTIDGFYSHQPVITPTIDIDIQPTATNTILRNCTLAAPVTDAGTNTGYTTGGTPSMANLHIGSSGVLAWSSTTSPIGTVDTGISRDSAGTIMMGNGTQDDASAVVNLSLLQAKRITARRGTLLVVGDFALSSGWGTSVLSLTNSYCRDHGGEVAIAASGTLTANPTVTLTFADGTFGYPPAVVCARGDQSAPQSAYWAVTNVTSTAATFMFVGTPITATTYALNWIVLGL